MSWTGVAAAVHPPPNVGPDSFDRRMNPVGFRSDAVLNVGDSLAAVQLQGTKRLSDGVPEATSILEVDGLSVRFGQSDVLKNLAFTVAERSVVAIIGPNGAGKTVLLRALLGSIPLRGSVRWAPGTRIGYVPQKLDLERDVPMTGRDLLRARLALAGDSDVKLDETFALVGIPSATADRLIGTYSGGQFQRLLIAFALLGTPTVLMLDEPSAGVDERGQEQVTALINRVRAERRLTVLYISHDLSVVSSYSDMVLCLGGRQPYYGRPEEILTPEVLQDAFGMAVRFHVHDH